jgi:hypothetical protein
MVAKVDGGPRLRYCPRLNSVIIIGIPHRANMMKYGIRNVAAEIKKNNIYLVNNLFFNVTTGGNPDKKPFG